MSEPAQEKWFSQTIHTYKPYWLGWVVIFFEAHFVCHDILMLGKSPIKWRQRPDMAIAVDWDVKRQFKQTKLKSRATLTSGNVSTLYFQVYMYRPMLAQVNGDA